MSDIVHMATHVDPPPRVADLSEITDPLARVVARVFSCWSFRIDHPAMTIGEMIDLIRPDFDEAVRRAVSENTDKEGFGG